MAGLEPGCDDSINAIKDIEMAKEFDPSNADFYDQGIEEIQGSLCPANLAQMHQMVLEPNGRVGFAHALKELGDSQFARANYGHAIHVYSLAEEKARSRRLNDSLWYAKIKSNKSAALYALQRFDDAVGECDCALAALTGGRTADTTVLVEWMGRQREQSGSKALGVLHKVLLHKAACQTHTRHYEQGLATLSTLKLCLTMQPGVPQAELDAVDQDYQRIRKLIAL